MNKVGQNIKEASKYGSGFPGQNGLNGGAIVHLYKIYATPVLYMERNY